MAPFNPPVQATNPSAYGGNARPSDVPNSIRPQGVAQNTIMPEGVKQGDMSAQYAGEAVAAGDKAQAAEYEGYGDLFKEVTGGVDFLAKAGVTMVKKDIEDKVYEVADRERQSYTDLLEKIKSGVGVKNVLDANAQDTGEESTPADVANLPNTLDALTSARDSGKISGSYYQSKLLAEAKQLRAQYPGFREEIDQQFTKVTGSNPANAYITSLVQDINRANTSGNAQKQKTLTYIRNNLQFPGAEQKYRDYNAGLIADDDINRWAAPYEQQKYNLNMNALKYSDDKNTREDRQRQAGDNIDYAAGVTVNRAADTITQAMGLNSASDVSRLQGLEQAKAISPQQWQDWGQRASSAKLQLRNQMIADTDRQGYTKDAGGKAAVIAKIDASLAPMDGIIDRIYNHDFGGIYDLQKQLTAQNDQNKSALLGDKKLGPFLQTTQALKDIGGEQNLQQFSLDAIKGDFPDDFKAYFANQRNTMATQYNMKTTGVPYTFNDTIENLQKNKVNNTKLNSAMLGEVKKIYDPNVSEPVRMNYAMAAFSDGNRGMISKLVAAGNAGSTSAVQNKVFQDFTSPEMTTAMHTLGKKDPQIWDQYVNWSKETLANELINKEINGLKQVPENSGVSVGWDAANHRFQTIDTRDNQTRIAQDRYRGSAATAPTSNSYFNTVNASVNRMNSNIGNFKHIAEASGQDIDAFVLHTIADSAGKESLSNVQGIPYNIIRDMGLAKYKKTNGQPSSN